MMKNTKKIIALVAIVLLMTATVGSTLAYLIADAGPIANIFNPAKVTCKVNETMSQENGVWTKSGVTIENTGNTTAYIRVAVVGNWCDDNGNVVEPWIAKDSYFNLNDWEKGNDGFFYCKTAIPADAPNDKTPALIYSYGKANENGLHLEMNIVAQAIQATDEAVADAWKSK